MWRRISKLLERLDVAFTRGPSIFRRFGIPSSPVPLERRGLVIVQVDGLSYDRLLSAMRRRQMPFLQKLVKHGRYRLQPFLSEIPTSTPAFQAVILYGSNDNIPGFVFYDKYEKQLYRMGITDCAYAVQNGFKQRGLLRGGSIFSCVFTGDADSALFTFSTLLAPKRWKLGLRVWDIFVLSILNIALVFRLLALVALELVLAIYDSIKWIIRGGQVARELTIAAVRVALTVVTREVITLGAVVDIYRRVPIIYVNYLGYDEQAHMRGPDSPVARWTLRGIDRAIRRIYKATFLAERKYDLYILSDHGQCACVPFEVTENESIGEFMQSQLTDLLVDQYRFRDKRTSQMLRTAEAVSRLAAPMPRLFRWPMHLYASYLRRKVLQYRESDQIDAILDVTVVSSGPVAYAYWNRVDHPLTAEEIERLHPGLLDAIARNNSVGCISVRTGSGDVLVRSRDGDGILCAQSNRIRGRMPFDNSMNRDHVLAGIRRVTLMPRAGDICIWGGNSPKGDISYTFEFGAHSGWTNEEVRSFVLSPAHIDFDFGALRRHADFNAYFSRYAVPPAEPTLPEESSLSTATP